MSKSQVISDLINNSTVIANLSTSSFADSTSEGTPPNTPTSSSNISSKSVLKDLNTAFKKEETALKAELKHKVDEFKDAANQVKSMLAKHDFPAEFLSRALNENVGDNGMSVGAAVGKLALDLAANPQETLTHVTTAFIGEVAETAQESLTTCCWSFLK